MLDKESICHRQLGNLNSIGAAHLYCSCPGYTGAQLADKHNFIQYREGEIPQISHCFTLIIYHKVLTGPTCK